MLIKFTQAARKHRIGREHVRYVMATATPTTVSTTRGVRGWRWIGFDDRSVELTIIAIEAVHRDEPVLLVIHVQPNYRKATS